GCGGVGALGWRPRPDNHGGRFGRGARGGDRLDAPGPRLAAPRPGRRLPGRGRPARADRGRDQRTHLAAVARPDRGHALAQARPGAGRGGRVVVVAPGSVHGASWPRPEELQNAAASGGLDAASAVLGAVRKAKSDAKRKLRAPLTSLTVFDTPRRLAALRPERPRGRPLRAVCVAPAAAWCHCGCVAALRRRAGRRTRAEPRPAGLVLRAVGRARQETG